MTHGGRTTATLGALATLTEIATLATLGSCDTKSPVPLPDLARVEAAVASKIHRCRDAVLATPSAASWGLYGRTLHAHQMLEEAELAYLAAAASAGETTPAAFEHLHLAGLAALESHMERAARHFTRALSIRSDYLPTHLNLAIVTERLGWAEQSRKHYQLVLDRIDSSHAHLGLGRLALRAGDARAAVTHLRRALAADPKHKAAYEALARAYARLQQTDESRQAAHQAGDLSVTTPFTDLLLRKVNAEAIDIRSRFNRGARLANTNRDAAAILEFEAIVKARPRHIHARYNLAILLHRTGHTERAMPHLNQLLEQKPRHPGGLELRARVFLDRGQRQQAVADLSALLEIDPDHTWAKEQLARVPR